MTGMGHHPPLQVAGDGVIAHVLIFGFNSGLTNGRTRPQPRRSGRPGEPPDGGGPSSRTPQPENWRWPLAARHCGPLWVSGVASSTFPVLLLPQRAGAARRAKGGRMRLSRQGGADHRGGERHRPSHRRHHRAGRRHRRCGRQPRGAARPHGGAAKSGRRPERIGGCAMPSTRT